MVDEPGVKQAPPAYMPTSAKTEDWGTPAELVGAVRTIFGGEIDVDPCSNPWSIVGARREVMLPAWRETVEATRQQAAFHFAERLVTFGDGLVEPWAGNVYLNPPYNWRGLSAFMRRAAAYARFDTSSIMLAPSKTSLKGWQESVPRAAAVCFIDGRVEFRVPGTGETETAPFSSALILWTSSRELVHRFCWQLDGKLGHVMRPA